MIPLPYHYFFFLGGIFIVENGKQKGIYFKVSEEERDLIEQKMALAGVRNMSGYLRKMAIDGYVINLEIPELAKCAQLMRYTSNNVNQIARTMNYLQEHGLLAYPDLEAACDAAIQKYHNLSDCTKDNSARMREIAELQRHIGTYHKTREVYAQYRKLPPKKQKEFYAEHASAIISCEAAKRFFDGLGLKKLPSIQSLKQEYAVMEAENKKLYPDQKKARAEMMALLTAKYNTSRILGLPEKGKQWEQCQEER